MDIENALSRLNTMPLQQTSGPTKALVGLNERDTPFTGVAVFHASYPIRVPPGPSPVVIRSRSGHVLPSRIRNESLTTHPDLPENKRLWTFDLQVLVTDAPVPSGGGEAYGAAYGASPESKAPNSVWESALARGSMLTLWETDIHPGLIPVPFRLADIMDPVFE